MKKLLSFAAVLVFIVVLCGHTPAAAFDEKGRIYLAQQTEESTDKQSEASQAEASDEAETKGNDDDDDD